MDLLQTITALSHEFGTVDYVRGGGGNTSAKTANTLWIKPSGTVLAELTPERFIAMSRAKLGELYVADIPRESAAREAVVKDMMTAAVNPGESGRPSVEAPLHDILNFTYVVHNHPAIVNGFTCAQDGPAVCARLFPDALWVPYVDPGYTLCMDVRHRVHDFAQRHGHEPALIILDNHGIVAGANTADEIRAIFHRVMDALRAECRRAGIPFELRTVPPANLGALPVVKQTIQSLLGVDAAHIAGDGTAFAVPPGPISPDHMVYAKAYPYVGPLTADGLRAFRARWGYPPRLIITEAGVLGVGNSRKQADLAFEFAQDGALVMQYAAAFGGIEYLTDAGRDFIENWEVEAYRQKQMY